MPKIPPEWIEFARRLKEERPRTYEELQEEILKKFGGKVSTAAIAHRLKREGEMKATVHLTPDEQLILKERFGSVGAGIRRATRDAIDHYALPADPLEKRVFLELKNKFGPENPVPWKDIIDHIVQTLKIEPPKATRMVQELFAGGYMRAGGGGTYVINERKKFWAESLVGK
jgi:hypothetical protein